MEVSNPRLLVIADDLTGALDVGVEFGKRNVSTLVKLEGGIGPENVWPKCEVLALDSESRHVPSGEAARRVAMRARWGLERGASHFFKKTDSTLRGNVGSELSALALETGQSVYYVAAAPLYGRTTRDGYQYVGERLLHETEYAQDPLDPITTSFVPALLEKQSRIPVRWLKRGDLGSIKFGEARPPEITVFDASTEDDVCVITRALQRGAALGVLAGTARFASHLADVLALRAALPEQRICARGPILVINGSANAWALEQIRWALARKLYFGMQMPPEVLVRDGGWQSAEADRLVAELDRTGERDVLLHSMTHREELDAYVKAARPEEANQVHFTAATNLAMFVARVLARRQFRFIVVFGGDTLCALAKALNWPALGPRSEVVPGVAVSEVLGQPEFLVAAKPGGFGPIEVLETIQHFVHETNCDHDGR